ncbi:Crp/Fnr family transcriptional regulator [Parafilimonas terrae]|uniref:CRP/FNR family transcriptional regulator, anaerobic regulatory protein n=1 Tax=Parafilimonas terrae TaxID=1465490 RepID=A0A1I5SSF6_9BACT|nr:Crp/Fnr family transcriptional regulator [Parafilimonas terrae]SFP73447.1 CRP/FNR family transcriptional regulator, anaerobic regulatory protein [Parafilimonas terrae]
MDKLLLQKLFPGFENELYEEMLQHGVTRYVKEGETLLRVGQHIRSVILIIEGVVKLYREDDEGNEFFIYHLNAGQACSLSMVCAYKQETSEVMAKAITNATLLTVPLEFMDKWLGRYKGWYEFVITSYRNRFEELLKTIDAVAFSNMDERLEFYLKKQVAQFGPILKLTHHDIASDLNSSREVISRLLKKMEAKGLVGLNRNSIEWIKKINTTA